MMKYTIYLFSVTFLLAGCISQKKYEELKSEQLTCSEQLESITDQLNTASSELESLRSENLVFENLIEEQNTKIDGLQSELVGLENVAAQNEEYAATIAYNQTVMAEQVLEIEAMVDNFETVVEAVNPALYDNISSGNEIVWTDAQLTDEIAASAERNRTTRINNIIDTVETPRYKINEGNLAVFCPDQMTFKKPHDVMAMIADFISEEDVKDALFAQLQRHEPDIRREDLNKETTLIEKIEYYDLIRLELESPVKDAFEIFKVHDIDEQKIQRGMEGWHWKVTPVSDEPNQALVVKATFIAPNGGKKAPISKSYPINVTVEPTRFFHTAKMLIINDPGWAIVTLIIPFLTFLWGYFTKRKKDQKVVSGESS